MVSTGDTAPDISATIGTSDHEDFELSEHLGDGPVVVAFFPGAFTPPCSNEMVALEEHLDGFEDAGATVLGLSADSAFSLGAFSDEYDLSFTLVSDMGGEAIRDYGLEMEIPDLGLYGIANRAVYVLSEDGTVTYDWVADEPTDEPDYEALVAAAEDAYPNPQFSPYFSVAESRQSDLPSASAMAASIRSVAVVTSSSTFSLSA